MQRKLSFLLKELSITPSEQWNKRIDLCTKALSCIDKKSNIFLWLEVKIEKSRCLLDKQSGEIETNIENAISYLNETIACLKNTKRFMSYTVTVFNYLGIAYMHRNKGDTDRNIEIAIQFFKHSLYLNQSLYINDLKKRMNLFVSISLNLATAYHKRINESKEENLNIAIDICNICLNKLSINESKDLNSFLSVIYDRLCLLWIEKEEGNIYENAEKAIEYGQRALEIVTIESNPVLWGSIHHNIGRAYIRRIKSDVIFDTDKDENMCKTNAKVALNYFNKALKVRTKDKFPKDWALTMKNIGVIYSLKHFDDIYNDNIALDTFNKTLSLLSKDSSPNEWADCQFNIGSILLSKSSKHIENAITHFKNAEIFYSKKKDLSLTQLNLGRAYKKRIDKSKPYNHEKINYYFKKKDLSLKHLNLGRDNITKPESYHDKAIYYLKKSLNNCKEFPQLSISDYKELGDLYFSDHEWKKAIDLYNEVIEIGGNLFRTANTFDSKHVYLKNLAEIYNNHSYSLAKLSNIKDAFINFEINKTRLLVEQLNYEQPNSTFIFDLKSNFEKITSHMSPNEALIIPLITSQGTVVFILTNIMSHIDQIESIFIEDMTLNDSLEMILNIKENLFEDVSFALWHRFIEPLFEKLKRLKIKKIIFIPQPVINNLPLHAAWYEKDGKRSYLIDDFDISYAPSVYVLNACKKRLLDSARMRNNTLVISNPSVLPGTENEAKYLQNMQPNEQCTVLYNEQCTIANVINLSSNKNILHFGCHGLYNWENPAESGLVLDKWEILKPKDIIEKMNLHQARLIMLSACHTGMVDMNNFQNEYVGIIPSFIITGAPCVISSLWEIGDQSTPKLINRFYDNFLIKKYNICYAFNEAQRNYKHNTKFRDNSYSDWASFKVTGC